MAQDFIEGEMDRLADLQIKALNESANGDASAAQQTIAEADKIIEVVTVLVNDENK